ncbi:flagellar positioning protein PflI [Caulobacter sp. CCUG 60055]|uniref:DUF6468 domain-containing protein n=1 Tax=Caulobacter sp. CCUG 60055 TaxID=2100090 RepID=UPI001FA6E9C7|nr:DUF6468 domain-containing protein [Caulobacter sp. CCUG 60055]MCI3180216.1 flagellar positioning protein PflI [Caulobacter sp. CCUG 60055]
MSIVSLGMNLLLAGLLIAALAFGWRLDRKLKALREGHAGFAKAVADLDAAAARASTGLAELRRTADEAADILGGRLAVARDLTDKLEKLIARAERSGVKVEPAAAPASGSARAAPPPATPQAAPHRPEADAEALAESLVLRLTRDDIAPRPAAAPPAPPAPRAAAPVARTPAATVDEDLFDGPAEPALRLTPLRGGRR